MFNYSKYIAQLGYDRRKHMLIIALLHGIFLLFSVLVSIFVSLPAGLGLFGLTIIGLNLFLSNRYTSRIEALKQARVEAFIESFTIIKVFLGNNFNVYCALEEAIKYVKPRIREDLLRLLEDIDNDKSIDPYIRFARKFDPLVIEQLMIGLYQYDTEGGGINQLESFDYMFDQFRLHKSIESRRRYEERLDGMNLYPLLGAGIITMNLLFGVVIVILRAISEL
jgi:hypothetical protein